MAGRIALSTATIPLAELFFLYVFGGFLVSRGKAGAVLTGLAEAAVFYVYPLAWLPLAALFSGTVLYLLLKKPKGQWVCLWLFLVSFLASLLPFAAAVHPAHYGSYLATLVPRPGGTRDIQHQLLVSASYVTGLFWGKMDGDYYGPPHGGFLDPVSGALFFTGLLALRRSPEKGRTCFLLAAIVFSLLPGVASSNLEFFRIYFVLPFLLVVIGFGLEWILGGLPQRVRPAVTAGLCTLIFLLNLQQLFGPYQNRWNHPGPDWGIYKSAEFARASGILSDISSRQGPGMVFTAFQPDMADQGLALSTYAFNVVQNPFLAGSSPGWFALVTNSNYRPFLSGRFPKGQWVDLSGESNRPDGGLCLGVFPLDSRDSSLLNSWKEADSAFQDVAYAFLNRPTGTSYDGVIRSLLSKHPQVEGDRFLESCFWEKLYYLFLQNGAFGDKREREDFTSSLHALQEALGRGYPAAHLLNEYGTCLMLMGDRAGALQAFQKAVQINPGFGPALENQKILSRFKAGKKPDP